MHAITRLLLLSLALIGHSQADERDGSIVPGYGSVFGRAVFSDLPNAPQPGAYLGAMAVTSFGNTWLFGEFDIIEPTTALPIVRISTATGALDLAFGSGTGMRSSPFPIAGGTWFRGLNALAQADGKPIVTGGVRIAGRDRGFVCRLNAAGNFDASFGTAGCVTVRAFAFPAEDCGIEGLVITPSTGAITVVGDCSEAGGGSGQRAFTARFTSTGLLDTEYGAGAGVTLPQIPGVSLRYLRALALRSDGRIMAVGTVRRASNEFDIALLRLSNDGTLDPDYVNGGFRLLSVNLNGNVDDIGTGIAIRPDGRVLTMGTTESLSDDGEVVLWQTTADGALDPSFGTNGLAIGAEPLQDLFLDAAQNIAFRARMRLSIDDRGHAVVMSRSGSPFSQDNDAKVYRFLQNGRRDRSFGFSERGVVDIDNDVSLPGPGPVFDTPTFVLAERNRILIGTISVRDGKRYMVTLTLNGSGLFSDGFELLAASCALNNTLTVADPTFNRPRPFLQGGTCNLEGQNGNAARYKTIAITLSAASNVTASFLTADGGSIMPVGADTVLILYGPGGFNPASPCSNAITANDDDINGGTVLSKITTTTPLAAGNYTLVVTSFQNVPPALLPWNYTLAVTPPNACSAALPNAPANL